MKKMPTAIQAANYSSTLHYLRAVQGTGTSDTAMVMARMKATPIQDFFASNGHIRADGRMVHDMYLFKVKAPSASRYPWDYYARSRRTVPFSRCSRGVAPWRSQVPDACAADALVEDACGPTGHK